jgi:hypothetical protein
MLGNYQLGDSVLETARTSQQLIDDLAPTLTKAAAHYERISPVMDFATKYWSTSLVLLFGIMVLGSVAGNLAAKKIRG